MHYLTLYIEFIKIRIQSIAEYRGSFISGCIAQFVSYGAQISLIWIMINQFETIGGWGPFEVMLLYSLNLISYSLAAFFMFNPCQQLYSMIRSGDFDEILIRPLNELLYLITRNFNTAYVSHISLSIITIVICLMNLDFTFSFFNLFFLIIVIVSGALIQAAAFLITTIPVFWVISASNIMNVFFFNLKQFITYPLSIYNRFIQILLTIIIPYGFISFYPSQIFIDKEDFLFFHPIISYLSPFVGIMLLLVAILFWNKGVNHYESTGS
ncbi:ABC transporter permease [Natronospora cellulosivora (SeqCode)]